MNKTDRFIASVIIVAILALACFVSGLITKLLMLLPSPWCHIGVGVFLGTLLIGGVHVLLGKTE